MSRLLHTAWELWVALAPGLGMGVLALTVYQRRMVNPTREDIDRGDGPVITWVSIGTLAALALFAVIYGLWKVLHP